MLTATAARPSPAESRTAVRDVEVDASIVDGLRRRDQTAVETLFSTYGPMVRRWARSEGDEGEDVLQDVLMNIWRAADRLDESTNLTGFLRVVTQNVVKNRRRTRARRPAVPAGLEITTAERVDPISQRTERIVVQQVLDALAPRERTVLELLYLSDCTLDEAAGRLQTTREATKSLAARARRRLRSELRDEFALGA